MRALLDGADELVYRTVAAAYRAHADGQTALPHSAFLRFPRAADRIIALPGFVDGDSPAAGLKWISSFPGNLARGRERASAAIILNSLQDGRPVALLEGSVISARRTAASAALAATELTADAPPELRHGVGLVGCGVINFQVLRFLHTTWPGLAAATVYDLDPERARTFAAAVTRAIPGLAVTIAESADAALARHRVVSIATTASGPHLTTSACDSGAVVLHLSLRDLHPESVLSATNVVDDADHVCREGTSLELAERMAGNRHFIHAELGALLTGATSLGYDADGVTVFSPFGLGVLDIAVAACVADHASTRQVGLHVDHFVG